jgi:hypothetical protein
LKRIDRKKRYWNGFYIPFFLMNLAEIVAGLFPKIVKFKFEKNWETRFSVNLGANFSFTFYHTASEIELSGFSSDMAFSTKHGAGFYIFCA